jgi:hypothetical protein
MNNLVPGQHYKLLQDNHLCVPCFGGESFNMPVRKGSIVVFKSTTERGDQFFGGVGLASGGFTLRGTDCPAPYADGTYDPKMLEPTDMPLINAGPGRDEVCKLAKQLWHQSDRGRGRCRGGCGNFCRAMYYESMSDWYKKAYQRLTEI